MSIRNLEKIFDPKAVAVVGASDDTHSVGYTLFRNLRSSGFEGPVYPVNPRRDTVQGVRAFPTVGKLPGAVDLVVVASPAASVPHVIEQCGRAGILGVVVTTAGFREVGEEGKKLEQELLRRAKPYGVRIIGPNCLGLIVPSLKLNASFGARMPLDGRVAFLSQSGALGTAVVEWAIDDRIGFSHFVSVGSMVDVDFGDLIDYFGMDRKTRSIVLYVETVSDARKFLSAARAFARTKPIVAVKSGRFAESMRAAASHTGALAGEDLVFDAAFRRAGIVRVDEITDLFNCAEILAKQHNPRGPRLAVLTNAGGPGIMATDCLIERGGELAGLSGETKEALQAALPPMWSRGNPVDIIGDAPPERFGRALDTLVEDRLNDGVLVILTPQAMTDPTETARLVGSIAARTEKPVLAAWMGGQSVREGIDMLNRMSVPTYPTPEQAVRTFLSMHDYSRNLEMLHETPKDMDIGLGMDQDRVNELLLVGQRIAMEESETLSEPVSKALLEAYGIPVVEAFPARKEDAAVRLAKKIGYPVVLKILSPDITHKSDAGGVVLGIESDRSVREAFRRIMKRAATHDPRARLEGVTVQRMIQHRGHELILGAKKDPIFGTVILFGMGGIAAEVFQDRAVALPPLNERLARRLIESIRGYKLLRGFRGRPPVNLDLLTEILVRFSYLVVRNPLIREMDINPLLAGPGGAWALDARVVLDGEALVRGAKAPYRHLAIHPYPEELVRKTRLRDGTEVTLRPARPEDVPLWHRLLGSFSPETLRFRYFTSRKEVTPEMAVRDCFIDYDRELTVVAEVEDAQGAEMVGIAHLIHYTNRETAEFAVAVGDALRGRGLGSLLTQYCIDVARDRGIREIVADMLPDNEGIIALLRRKGFRISPDEGSLRGVLAL